MRTVWTVIFTSAWSALAATSCGAPPQPPEDAQPPVVEARALSESTPQAFQAEIADRVFPKRPAWSLNADKEIAGLSPRSRPDLLTWQRVYALALVHTRAGRAQSAGVIDPKVRDATVTRPGVGDFPQFRQAFLGGRPGPGAGAFRDPSGDYLELLRRLQVIDNARQSVALHESCLRIYQELNQGEGSGQTAAVLDLVTAALVRSRQSLANEIAQFRDRLDELKAAVGLSPRALLIPDHQGIAAFRDVFEDVHNWNRDPARSFEVLSQRIERLPALGEVMIEGQPILGSIEANPDRLEQVLTAATQVANKSRAGREQREAARDADIPLELRIGTRIRRLMETRRAYDSEKRLYELGIRLFDQAVEQLMAPPSGVGQLAHRSPLETQALLDRLVQIEGAQDRLVGLWASFKAERLALYRDVGLLPYDDWTSFYEDLTARPGPIK